MSLNSYNHQLLQRVGLILDFAAFWFAAPEILGEDRLLLIERAVERALELGFSIFSRGLLVLFGGIIIITGSAYVASAYAPASLPLASRLAITFALLLAFNVILWAPPLLTLIAAPLRPARKVAILVFSLAVLALLVYVSFPIADALLQELTLACLVPVLLALAIAISGRMRDALGRHLALFLRTLANEQQIRRRSLVVAAFLFTAGFMLQLASTW